MIKSCCVCDINQVMLNVGKSPSSKLGYDKLKANGYKEMLKKLPFNDNSFDVYTIAFGIRNVVDINQTLNEACRV